MGQNMKSLMILPLGRVQNWFTKPAYSYPVTRMAALQSQLASALGLVHQCVQHRMHHRIEHLGPHWW